MKGLTTEDTEAATPETDRAERMAFGQEYMVPSGFARKLERERDEAMQALAKMTPKYNEAIQILREIWQARHAKPRQMMAKWEPPQ